MVALVAVLLFGVATVRLFILPATNAPAKVDAIVMLDGNMTHERRDRAIELARVGYAPVLVVSTPHGKKCPVNAVPTVRVICFDPEPVTTQGEARGTAELASRYGWKTILVVASRQQDTRARIRFERCYNDRVLVDVVTPRLRDWPYLIAYEWGALGKAMILQRGC